MNLSALEEDLFEALLAMPVIDAHTHLVGGHLNAKGLHDILLYHMSISDLYGAGCPSGSRLTEYPGFPGRDEAESRLLEAIPFLKHVTNTSSQWGIRMILSDLYGWNEPVTLDNWRRLDAQIRERVDDQSWKGDLLGRIGARRIGTEIARREQGQDDALFQYALEWAFFTRCQWGEYDTALYELERCWGRTPSSPTPIGAGCRPPTERTIRSLADVHAAIEHYVRVMASLPILSIATHISTDLNLSRVTDAAMEGALKNRDAAGETERNIYAAYIHEAFLSMMERKAPQIVFQFSYGAEPLPYETGSRLSHQSIHQLGEMLSHHPGLRFQCFLSSSHANQSLCTYCREFPNFSLAGYWWHNFFPSIIARVFEERLDMVPLNSQVGFFSDAYCLEWAYAKHRIVMRTMASVLAKKIRMGQYTSEDALHIAREICFETPQTLLGFEPARD